MYLLAMDHFSKSILLTVVIVILAVLLLLLLLGIVFFKIALGSKRRKDETVPCKNSLYVRNKDNQHIQNGYIWFDETDKQSVTTKNRKGKTLHAVQFLNPSNNDTWVITCHGWTNVKREQSVYAMEFYRRGFNVLVPEMRGHGDSESHFVSMGWLDRLDIVDWINWIVKNNPKAKIVLHGVSMGAATTMMVTGEELPQNVLCAIEDCGYTSVWDIFYDQCVRKYHLPPKLVMPAANFVNICVNHFSFKTASAIEQVKKSKTPTLFLHGDKDDFVLPENMPKVFDACAAKKDKHFFVGAEHAVSAYWNRDEYWQVVDNWLAEFFK